MLMFNRYFVRNRLDYPNMETSKPSKKYVKAMKHLHVSHLYFFSYIDTSLLNFSQDFILPTTAFNKQFLDLLRRIFVYDPKNRITAKQALKHPWFKESLIDDGTEALRIGSQLRRSDHQTAKQ